ncbi:MAG TPA: toprim domain-containing protein [Ktedonobacteraceae bacterium]|nr:toprim domain-containing protein [Ktedonobacteraceae bacterium]
MVENCVARLWSSTDTLALDYTHSRGFSDELILKARLGYSLKHDIPRLVIPSLNHGVYVAISYRDLRPDIPKDKRWQDIPGGTKGELYLADCLESGRPTVVLEAPLDALSVVQTCADLVSVVATGGTNGAKNRKNVMRLALQDLVFFAFDADEAGDKEAQWWLDRLPNARRLRPKLHDANDMLVQGWDIRQWVIDALQAAGYSAKPSYPPDQAAEDIVTGEREAISYEQEQSVSPIAPSLDNERFMSYVRRIANSLPVPCTIVLQPRGTPLQIGPKK